MKTIFTILFSLFLFDILLAQAPIELPFFDDFTNDYENWTSYSISGDEQWHLSGDDGINGSKCARFYITTNPAQANNDWLVSKVFNTEDISNIAIEFKYWFHGDGMKPEFYYTTSFSGEVSETDWTELDNSFWKNEWTWNSARIEIENPGNTLVFAIRYQSTNENSEYVLIDNFSMKEFEPVVYEKVGTTEHFEFFTSIADETDYWLELKDELEIYFQKYCGIWNIVGKEDFIDKSVKTKIYYTEKTNIPFVNETTPETKSGFCDWETKTIYLSPLNTPQKEEYYESMEGLAINTFAGYAKKHQLFREDGYDGMPGYYTEGFGLYEQGFRPSLDSIVSFRSKHPDDLTHEDLDAMNVFNGTSQKDIIVSYVEGQIVGLLDYYGTAPYSSYQMIWNNHLIYFYDTTDVVRIKKYASNDNFDIYCSSRDTMFIDSFFVWLERPRQFYIDSFQIEVNRKFNLIIYYDEKTGMDMTGYDNWNGGAGGMNISPHNFGFGIYDRYNGLLAHEFGHVYNSVMYPDMPFGFYHEGMAELSNYVQSGDEHLDALWKINYVFNYYQDEHGRDPTLDEIINNPHAGQPGLEYGIDCYFFGFEFMRFLRNNEGLLKMKEFFTSGLDFDVFEMSYTEIEQGYIDYLKCLNTLRDFNPPRLITNTGLTLQRGTSVIISTTNLHATDQEVTDENLHFILRKPPVHGQLEKVTNPEIPVFKFNEKDLKNNQIRYVNDGNINATDNFTFKVTDRTFIIDHQTFKITVNTPTEISGFDNANTNALLIYPNPITSESVISFQTKSSGKVNLSVYDIHGRKISTILNKNLPAGSYNYSLGKTISSDGVYFLRLKTQEGISTQKFIYMKE
jgi:hypothetical protein